MHITIRLQVKCHHKVLVLLTVIGEIGSFHVICVMMFIVIILCSVLIMNTVREKKEKKYI